jgi:hypothetical protein
MDIQERLDMERVTISGEKDHHGESWMVMGMVKDEERTQHDIR